jgi:hypothetical protein
MKNSYLSSAALLVFAISQGLNAQSSKPKIFPPEPIVEATAHQLILPAGPSGVGTLVFTECIGCTPQSFRTSVTTVYRINDRAVTLAQFRTLVAQQPQTNVNLVRNIKTGELLALDATVEGSDAARK